MISVYAKKLKTVRIIRSYRNVFFIVYRFSAVSFPLGLLLFYVIRQCRIIFCRCIGLHRRIGFACRRWLCIVNTFCRAWVCIADAQIFGCEFCREQNIVFVDAPILYSQRGGGKRPFHPVGIGIFFILIKRNRFLTVGQYQLSSLAVVASLYFRSVLYDGIIIGKHIDLVDLDARGLS